MRSRPFRAAFVLLVLAATVDCRRGRQNPDFPSLLQALRSPEPNVRGPAAYELIAIGEPAAEPVAALLKDPDARVRHMAAMTLQNMGAKARPAVLQLTEALADTSPEVRTTAAIALRAFGSAAAPAVPALTKALKDRESVVRLEAARALGEIGQAAEPAVPVLLEVGKLDFMREAADDAVRKIQIAAARSR
jgi:HEAT repeat protein